MQPDPVIEKLEAEIVRLSSGLDDLLFLWAGHNTVLTGDEIADRLGSHPLITERFSRAVNRENDGTEPFYELKAKHSNPENIPPTELVLPPGFLGEM